MIYLKIQGKHCSHFGSHAETFILNFYFLHEYHHDHAKIIYGKKKTENKTLLIKLFSDTYVEIHYFLSINLYYGQFPFDGVHLPVVTCDRKSSPILSMSREITSRPLTEI